MARFSPISWMRLPCPEAEPGALFGAAVAVGGGRIVVGAPSKDGLGPAGAAPDAGRAWVLGWDGTHWAPQATLTAPEARGSLLGASVGIWGHRIVVGAPRARVRGTPHAGHVLVFVDQEGRWERSARLTDPHGAEPEDGFGRAVAIYGDLVVVGAPLEVSDAGPPGVVHAFRHAPEGPWAALRPPGWRWRSGPDADPPPEERPGSLFGQALALGPEELVVAQDRWGGGAALGVVYVLEDGAWRCTAVLRPEPGVAGPGASVALHQDLLAVGVPTSPLGGRARVGVVQLFRRSGARWSLAGVLRPPVAEAGLHFGAAVAVHGEVVVVGAPGARLDGEPDVGAVFISEAGPDGSFPLIHHLSPEGNADRVAGARLGASVAMDATTVVAGAPGADPERGGAAIVIEAA